MARGEYVVTGNFSPVKDKRTGQQVLDPEKGKKWRITAELPRRGGKRNRKYRDVYGSERKAREETYKFVAEVNRSIALHGIPDRSNASAARITFGECMEMWLEANRDSGKLARRTWEDYSGVAKKHVIPLLGDLLLQDVLPFHIAKYRDVKLKEGKRLEGGRLSSATVNKHLSLISDVLEDAASPERGLIPHNPARLVARAAGSRNRTTAVVNCLSRQQLIGLLGKLAALYSLRRAPDSVKNRPETIAELKGSGLTDKEINSPKALFKFKVAMLYPIVYLAAVTGMRLSELLALTWEDVDFESRRIRVFESSHFGRKGENGEAAHHINRTKEGKPKAPIDISARDVDFLKNHRRDQEQQRRRYRGEYYDNRLVFAKKNGSYLRNDTVGSEFTAFARSVGMQVTFHGLRHTHCTLLLEKVPTMYVSRRLGHLLTSTTDDIYAHVDKAGGVNLSQVFRSILFGDVELPSGENGKRVFDLKPVDEQQTEYYVQ